MARLQFARSGRFRHANCTVVLRVIGDPGAGNRREPGLHACRDPAYLETNQAQTWKRNVCICVWLWLRVIKGHVREVGSSPLPTLELDIKKDFINTSPCSKASSNSHRISYKKLNLACLVFAFKNFVFFIFPCQVCSVEWHLSVMKRKILVLTFFFPVGWLPSCCFTCSLEGFFHSES